MLLFGIDLTKLLEHYNILEDSTKDSNLEPGARDTDLTGLG